jgi:diacylglycerol O-acyltransferase / wax synthase
VPVSIRTGEVDDPWTNRVSGLVAELPTEFNLVISNVPGPRQPVYLTGAQLCHQFPVSIVTDGQGLNITVVSYLDRLDFGFIADRDLVPDVWDLADMHIDEIGRLFEASGAESVQPPQPPHPRRGRVRRDETKAGSHVLG